ncbi:enoyl-CoA hydratase [Mumia zhuanghuii]|uniref:Enoyl-CoA hydratase-related protein n=2 Tax=Mumia TaxID=1546255 RepID=A0ABW1QKP2_9ACTN|nr:MULTISPECIES: enoyl-CoA hydratase-related protein [Mumia]KAA1423025.1 enoyl-CoA hydratase [Mumia zhuanghuii]
MSDVAFALDHHVATLTLSRPDSLNALSDSMLDELVALFDRCDTDDDVRCIVLTGAGRAFSAGADLSGGADTFADWFGGGDSAGAAADAGEQASWREPRRDAGGVMALRIYDSLKPVIVALNGPAVGGGASLTLPADLRLACPEGTIGFVFTARGLVPESCSSWFLPRLVGMSTAQEWILTSRKIGADEALAKGLLHAVHPADRLMDEAYAIADRISTRTAPVSASLARRMLWRSLELPHPMRAHEIETRALDARSTSADVREGVTAFLEKRPPQFRARVSTDLPDVFASLPTPAYVAPRLAKD